MRTTVLAAFATLAAALIAAAPTPVRAQTVPDLPTGSGAPLPQAGATAIDVSVSGPATGAWLVGSPVELFFARWLASQPATAFTPARPAVPARQRGASPSSRRVPALHR